MILSFSVENYKSIRDKATISFEAAADRTDESIHTTLFGNTRILRVAALYGANASGKTNMLDALGFLRCFVVDSPTSIKPNDPTGFIPFAFDPHYKNSDGTFNINFIISQIKYEYTLSLNSRLITSEKLFYSPKGQPKRIFERSINNDETNYSYKYGRDSAVSKEIIKTARKNIPLISSIVQLIDNDKFKKVYDWFEESLSPVFVSASSGLSLITMRIINESYKLKDKIVEILQSSDFGSIKDIELISEAIPQDIIRTLPNKLKEGIEERFGDFAAKKVMMKHEFGESSGKIPLEDESEGTKRFFDLSGLLVLSLSEPLGIIIDEIESSLHPELLEQVLSLFLNYGRRESQLIFTTHNAWLMDSGLLRRDEIWLTEKDSDTGASRYHCLSDIRGTRSNESFARKYLAGKFGAIPRVGMPVLED